MLQIIFRRINANHFVLVPSTKFQSFAPSKKCIVSSWSVKNVGRSIKHSRTFCSSNIPRNDTSLPKLIYIQHPLKYLRKKWDMLRLKLFWDFSFKEREFVYGSTKAVTVMTDFIRNQNAVAIFEVSTPLGFKHIARDMILSKDDPRLGLLRFRVHDIQKAIPIKVQFLKPFGSKHVLIDMFFVGMRNIDDFEATDNTAEVFDKLRKFDLAANTNRDTETTRRIVFAEIYAQFHRVYTRGTMPEWSMAFFKIASFDVFAVT